MPLGEKVLGNQHVGDFIEKKFHKFYNRMHYYLLLLTRLTQHFEFVENFGEFYVQFSQMEYFFLLSFNKFYFL